MLKRILGIVGWLGMALVLVAVAIRFLRPLWDVYAYWLAWAGLVSILLYTLGQWREIAGFFARRQARLGAIAAAGILIVLGILAAINYIASRENKRWDLTARGQYTLSDQTRKVLGSLDAPLKVYVFEQETRMPRFKDRMAEYEYLSKQVGVEYVDPDKKPALARQYQIQQYGTVVFEFKGRTERVTTDAEQDLTNGIIKVVTGRERKVYFVQGHGEKDTAGTDRTGLSAIATALGHDNYKVEKFVLAQQAEVPADASIVVGAGPRMDYLPTETDALRAYLQKGGKCLFMLDPPDKADGPPFTNLLALIKDWGIEVGTNVVVDVSGIGQIFGTDASVPVAASYPQHPITDRFNLLTAYELARSVTPIPSGANGRMAQSIVETSPKSWAETDLKGLLSGGQVALEEAKGDKAGPVSVAAAVSAPAPEAPAAPSQDKKPDESVSEKPETRVVVVGDSDFAANFRVGFQGNRDFFMNVVNWLAQQENLIAIRPREPEDRRVTLTADQQRRIMLLTLAVIPLAIFALALRRPAREFLVLLSSRSRPRPSGLAAGQVHQRSFASTRIATVRPEQMLAKDSRLESRVPDITRFFDQQDSLSKQHDGITQIRKSRAVSSVGTAIALVVIGTLASLYGIADVFGGLKLPLGVWLLLGGPIMIPIGIYVGYSSLHRIATASQFSYETALGELCALFYWNVFCKKTSDLESKDDQIVDVCQFIPLPVLQHYRRSGWGTLAAKPRPRSGGYTVHCVRCHKKSDHVESYYTSIPVPTKFREEFRHEEPAETQALIKNLYLRCLECGTDICYECACYSTPKELRSLCPVCGKATSGFEGLASRWMNLRTSRTDQDIDFSLSSVVIDMMPRSDQRIVDVTIHLSGTPFGTLSLSNVAFNVEGNWFLATPEPFVR